MIKKLKAGKRRASLAVFMLRIFSTMVQSSPKAVERTEEEPHEVSKSVSLQPDEQSSIFLHKILLLSQVIASFFPNALIEL